MMRHVEFTAARRAGTGRMGLAGTLRSEVVRLRHSSLVPLHLVLAIALGGAAGAYFGLTPTWDPYLSADAFFQLLGAGAPLLVGLSCGLAMDAERDAGDYANILGVPSRRLALVAKAIVLLLLGVAAAALAAMVFCMLMVACGRPIPEAFAIVQSVLCIGSGSVATYVILLAVGLRFGRNASIGLGAIGFLVAVASLGGLANGLVTGTFSGAGNIGAAAAIPFVWPAHLASVCIEIAVASTAAVANGAAQIPAMMATLKTIMISCVCITVLLSVLGLMLANRFEDMRQSGE